MQIRKAVESDFKLIFPIVKDVFSRGDTYVYTSDLSDEEIYNVWIKNTQCVYVALDDGVIVGTYYIKPNQPGRGSHVCNAGYIVSPACRGKGIGKAMCLHSIEEAKKYSYTAMQYNLVVSTNSSAVKLWESCGFNIVGTLSKAFNHKELGYVDAYIMFNEF